MYSEIIYKDTLGTVLSRHSSVGKASVWSHTVRQQQQCLLAGVWKRMAWLPCWPPRGQQVSHQNLRECVTVTHAHLPSMNKTAHFGFKTQRCHQKSKSGVSVAPQKGLISSKNNFLKYLYDFLSFFVVIFVATKETGDVEGVADILGVSAVIVQDLKMKRGKHYPFSWDATLKFRGRTGVFLQCCHARLFK